VDVHDASPRRGTGSGADGHHHNHESLFENNRISVYALTATYRLVQSPWSGATTPPYCRGSEQLCEWLFGHTGLANQGAECPLREFAVVGHGEAPARGMPEDLVAARLVIHVIADLLKRADRVRAATDWQRGHTETSMIASVTGPGTGSPCFSRLWR
jgi:hypothetical protein